MTKTTTCSYCGKPMVWFGDCPYPAWYHVGATPRHGEWVPEHDCPADWSKATDGDVPNDCGGQP